MKTMIVLIGNIGSGKSTSSKTLANLNYIILCRDAVRYMCGGGSYLFNPEIEPVIHNAFYKTTEEFLKKDIDVVIDETNMSRATRKTYIKLAKKYGYYVVAFVMPEYSKEESVQRRLKNNHGDTSKEVWEQVWDRFHKQYQVPTLQEGFDLIKFI